MGNQDNAPPSPATAKVRNEEVVEENRELRAALHQLQLEQRRFDAQQHVIELLLGHAEIVVWELRPDGSRDLVAGAYSLTPLTEAVVRGDTVHRADLERAERATAALLEDGEPFRHELRRLVGGRYRWVMEQARAIPSPEPDVDRRLVGISVDVHETKRTAIEAQRLAKLRERMVSIVGHDLRSPLGAAQMGFSTMKVVTDDPEVLELIQPVERALKRASGLVADLLDYVRGRDPDGFPLERAAADLVAIARQQVEEAKLAYPDVSFTLETPAPSAPAHVDDERVAQALANLIGNAAKYGDGAVVVRAAPGRLEVENGGEPISPEVLEDMFEPFHAKSGGGLGLGLYIAHSIVEGHGGRIDVDSTEERTRFTVELGQTSSSGS